MEEDSYGQAGATTPYMPDPVVTVQRRMAFILLAAILFMLLFGVLVARSGNIAATAEQAVEPAAQPETSPEQAVVAEQEVAPAPEPAPAATGGIAPLFTKEVQYWAPQIVAWANEYGLDPNMAATVMQIESCGDPNAVSSAGAQGLFQVMPFHFEAGESMQDPDTNARRGMAYLALGMQQTGGDVNRTFAGYNGGHGTAARSWDTWPAETQRYYVWSTGIYQDAAAGHSSSERLNEWLAAGGASLCQQAAARLGIQQ